MAGRKNRARATSTNTARPTHGLVLPGEKYDIGVRRGAFGRLVGHDGGGILGEVERRHAVSPLLLNDTMPLGRNCRKTMTATNTIALPRLADE